jgi:hypothetical protein
VPVTPTKKLEMRTPDSGQLRAFALHRVEVWVVRVFEAQASKRGYFIKSLELTWTELVGSAWLSISLRVGECPLLGCAGILLL